MWLNTTPVSFCDRGETQHRVCTQTGVWRSQAETLYTQKYAWLVQSMPILRQTTGLLPTFSWSCVFGFSLSIRAAENYNKCRTAAAGGGGVRLLSWNNLTNFKPLWSSLLYGALYKTYFIFWGSLNESALFSCRSTQTVGRRERLRCFHGGSLSRILQKYTRWAVKSADFDAFFNHKKETAIRP